MDKTKSLALFLFLFSASIKLTFAGRRISSEKYRGYKVFHVNSTSKAEADELNALFDHLQADVWKSPSTSSQHFDVMIPPHSLKRFETSMLDMDSGYSVWIDDVNNFIQKSEGTKTRRYKRKTRNFRYDEYHDYKNILRWMRSFSRMNSDVVSMLQVGTTYEGKRIWGIKVSVNNGNRKKVLWQDSLIHSREWITGATLLWVTNRIVEGYRRQEESVLHMLTNLDFAMVPVWNVDGYKYTWSDDRLWRKSRSNRGSHASCRGVDLNRNFDTPMRGSGVTGMSSNLGCSGVYQGSRAFSEPETATVAAYLRTLDIAAFVSVHSFAQLWLYPFGYTTRRTPDQSELKRLSRKVVNAMYSAHQTKYTYGKISSTVYKVSGGSADWVHEKLCVKYAFGVELRDRGKYGFLLPAEYIAPTAEEYYNGLIVLANHVISANSTRSTICTENEM